MGVGLCSLVMVTAGEVLASSSVREGQVGYIRKNYFSGRAVGRWKRLPREERSRRFGPPKLSLLPRNHPRCAVRDLTYIAEQSRAPLCITPRAEGPNLPTGRRRSPRAAPAGRWQPRASGTSPAGALGRTEAAGGAAVLRAGRERPFARPRNARSRTARADSDFSLNCLSDRHRSTPARDSGALIILQRPLPAPLPQVHPTRTDPSPPSALFVHHRRRATRRPRPSATLPPHRAAPRRLPSPAPRTARQPVPPERPTASPQPRSRPGRTPRLTSAGPAQHQQPPGPHFRPHRAGAAPAGGGGAAGGQVLRHVPEAGRAVPGGVGGSPLSQSRPNGSLFNSL